MSRILNRTPTVLGIDPGFRSVGYSLVELMPTREKVIWLGSIRTEKATKKANVLACEDNLVRAREIALNLRQIISTHSITAICAESMSFPRQSSVAAKMAMCWGLLADISLSLDLPIVQATPQRIKKVLCGANNASKEAVQDAVKARYPEMEALLEALPKTQREHPADSVGAVVACLDSEVIRMARRMR